jgi:hypothetical protein
MKSDKEVRPSIICDSNNFSEYNACLFSSIHDDQHKVDECDDKLMQVHEVIKECDRAQYSSTMHFSSLDSTVPLSKQEDVSSFSLHEFVSVNHLSQHKVDAVDFLQGSIYHNEVNLTPCSPVTPKQASGSAKGFSLDAHCFPPTFVQPISATAGFMSGSCATDAALPLFSAAAAATPVVASACMTLPGVYSSGSGCIANMNEMENGYGDVSLPMSLGITQKGGTGVFLGGRYSMEEVINFGGISHTDSMVQSSERIREQSNADATQKERVVQLTEAKNIRLFFR